MASLGLGPNWAKTLANKELPLDEAFEVKWGGRPRIIDPAREAISFYGVPVVGSEAAFDACFSAKQGECGTLLDKLVGLEDPHVAWSVLSRCLGLSKIMHLIRCLPLKSGSLVVGGGGQRSFERMLSNIDEGIRNAIESLVGLTLDEGQRVQARLPRRLGGLGHLSALQSADAAYVVAAVQSAPLVSRMLGIPAWTDPNLAPALERLNATLSPLGLELKEQDLVPTLQQSSVLERLGKVHEQRLNELKRSPEDQIRLQSLREDHSLLDALRLTPNPFRGQWLSPPTFAESMKFILGMHPEAGDRCAVCGTILDAHGHHITSGCRSRRLLIRRHNAVRDEVATEARRTAFSVAIERPLRHEVGNPPRQADVLISNYFANTNRDAALDIAVVSPLQQNYLNQAVGNPQYVLEQRANGKRRKYAGSIPDGVAFIPMVVDIYGNWSSEARKVFKRLADSVATNRSLRPGQELAAFYGRLALILLRHHAWASLDRSPGHRPDIRDDL
jgi:hypothetical protein